MMTSKKHNNNTSKILSQLYYSPKTGYAGGVEQLYRKAVAQNPELSRDTVRRWLERQKTYTIHRSARRHYSRNRVLVNDIDFQWQADLADLSNLKEYNDNYTFLLNCIDVFSKFAWSVPLKNKSSQSILNAFKFIIDSLNRKPYRLQTDAGTEFLNKSFQEYLKSMDIIFFVTKSETKASIVERFNRTLKERIYRYFTHNNNAYRYLDVLDDLVHGYNNSFHRTIGMAPADVTYQNKHKILHKAFFPMLKKNLKFKFNVGDHVRISKLKRTFEKGYSGNWTDEIFIIQERIKRQPPVYKLIDLHSDPIEGVFYEPELQLVLPAEKNVSLQEQQQQQQNDNDNVRDMKIIERVLKKRKNNGVDEFYVKWRHQPDSENSWVQNISYL